MAKLLHVGVMSVLLVAACTDCDKIKDDAFELRDRYAGCAQASCASPVGAVCNGDTGRCDLVFEER